MTTVDPLVVEVLVAKDWQRDLLPIYWILGSARGLAIRHGVLTSRMHDPLRQTKSKAF